MKDQKGRFRMNKNELNRMDKIREREIDSEFWENLKSRIKYANLEEIEEKLEKERLRREIEEERIKEIEEKKKKFLEDYDIEEELIEESDE